MPYRVLIVPSAEKDLNALPLTTRKRIWKKIAALSDSPRPRGTRKLEDEGLYKVRVGDYRIVHRISDKDGLVTILAVGHRREVYR